MENGWNEWSKYVLASVDEIKKDVKKLVTDVATLKVKAGIWGLVGGGIPVIILIGVYLIRQ